MTRLSPQDVERRLTETPVPAPPAELARRIKKQIPAIAPAARRHETERGTRGLRPAWLIAASLSVAVLGGLLAWRVSQEMPPPQIVRDTPPAVNGPASEPPALSHPETKAPEPPAVLGPAQGSVGATVVTDEAGPQPAKTEADEVRPVGVAGESSAPGSLTQRSELFDRLRQVTAPGGAEPKPSAPTVNPREVPEPVRPQAAETGRGPAHPVASELVMASPPEAVAKRVIAPPPGRLIPMPEPGPRPVPPSTGGTTEPNDQPYGDMFFESYGVNPFVDTEDDRLSTFGLDVDTGSYTVVRSYLGEGHRPPPAAVRVEELINYFDYGDPAPERGDFAIRVQGGPAPFASGPRYQTLRFNLRARDVDPAERKSATLIFVVDVSGSMNRGDRLELVKKSLALLLDRLRPDDRVALVIYGSRGRVLLEPTGDLEAIRSAIGRLLPGGSTNAEEGLVLAYELARRHERPDAIHRVILCSDGVANVGRTGAESILERVRKGAEDGIELTTVGFGMGNYNDVLMEQLANQGDGSYAYVDTLGEARRIFVEKLTGMLQTIAGDAKAQVEFNPEIVSRYRLLGYENRDIADERFRDDTVDAGEIGAGHSVTALYEIKLRDDAPRRGEIATLRLRYRSKETGKVVETAQSIGLADIAPSWEKAPRELKLAALVAEFGEILKGSYWAKDGDLEEVFTRAQKVSAEFAGDKEVADFVSLVGLAARLPELQSSERR